MARARNKSQGTNTPPTAETLPKTQSVACDIDENIESTEIIKKKVKQVQNQ